MTETEPGGSRKDWEHLINMSSSTLEETKNLVGHMRQMLDESKAQSDQNKATLRWARWTLAVAVVAVLVSVVLAFLV